jgi:hypothetical protein
LRFVSVLIDQVLCFVLVMDSQTHQGSYYTNLVLNDDDLFIESTNEECEHQESSPYVKVQPTGKKTHRGGNFTVNKDNMLVSEWLYFTMDAVIGNEQKHKAY